jgi:cytochrome b561
MPRWIELPVGAPYMEGVLPANGESPIMQLFGTRTRFGAVAQAFHWITVVLVVAAYFLGEGGSESRVYSGARASSLQLHETLGILVFAVVLLRVLWRIVDRVPEEPPMPGWMALASRLVQWALYAMLIAVPLTAIVGAWYEGHPVTFIGVGDIGPWLSLSQSFGRTIMELHSSLGSFIVWVAGAHAAAALFHHFFLRDRVLLAMLPGGPDAVR